MKSLHAAPTDCRPPRAADSTVLLFGLQGILWRPSASCQLIRSAGPYQALQITLTSKPSMHRRDKLSQVDFSPLYF
jgi:hypothetical protein